MHHLPTTDLTQKAERTRQHILDTALNLFVVQGYEATTMRAIAAKAECSLGLTYRYFARKEDLVLALYHRLALDLEAQALRLPAGRVAERFEAIMQAHFALLAPYQEAFAALFGAALNPRSGVGVLGESTAAVRAQVGAIFTTVVTGASDAPGQRQAADLATVLFGVHLGLVLFWLQDRSQKQRATHELLAFTRDLLALVRPLLRLPPAARMLARLARLLGAFFLASADTSPPPARHPDRLSDSS